LNTYVCLTEFRCGTQVGGVQVVEHPEVEAGVASQKQQKDDVDFLFSRNTATHPLLELPARREKEVSPRRFTTL